MLTSEGYKRKAENCRRLALSSRDNWAHNILLEMADLWDELAAKKAKVEMRSEGQSDSQITRQVMVPENLIVSHHNQGSGR
jgi:hypothetical protein